LLVKDDLSGAIKAYQDFQASKKTELRGGVMEGRLLKEDDVKALGDLPSKEADCSNCWGAQCLGSQDVGINRVPASLGRSLKAVSEKEQSNAEETLLKEKPAYRAG